jgi:hypothetical protein
VFAAKKAETRFFETRAPVPRIGEQLCAQAVRLFDQIERRQRRTDDAFEKR